MPESRLVAYLVLGLVVAVICAYALVVRADFINYDDNSHVFENPLVKAGLSWHGLLDAFGFHASLWIPLTWISFMADVSLFGLNPGAMHAVNLAWHVASTVLLFFTLRRMTGQLWASAFVAALFGLHPLNVESVAWVAERKSVLNTFFWFAALAAYARYTERPRLLPYLAALAAMALALMAKPMAVTLPCTLLLLDAWPLNRLRTVAWRQLFVEKIPFFLLTLGSCWITMHAPRKEAVVTAETLSIASRVSNALVSYVVYLRMLALPVNLGVFYPHPIQPQPLLAASSALLLLAISAFAVWSWKKRPYLLVGWCWFLGVLVPVIGLLQIGSQARADRFCYVPEIGIFLALTWLVKDLWPQRTTILRAVAAAILLAFALLTARQVTYWQDGATLFEHTIAVTKNNACAYANAGLHRAQAGDSLRAIQHYENSLRILPDQSTIWRELGVELLKINRPQDAVKAFHMALHYVPTDMDAHYRLAIALQKEGAMKESATECRELLRDLPASAGLHYYLARALESQGQHDEALAQLREAAHIAPDHPVIAPALRQVEAGARGVAAYPDL
jgi:tetratricopeptide (TPR) repeat protein